MSEIRNDDLFSAVEEGNLEAVRSMTTLAEYPDLKTFDHGFDLICTALRRNHKDIAKFLIDQGIRITSARKKNTALHEAVLHGDLELIDLLVRKGISVYSKDSKSMTPFLFIAKRVPDEHCSEILDFFLKKGVKISNKNSENQFTITHYAAELGNVNLIRLLKDKYFPSLNFRTNSGLTPLHVAVMTDQIDVVTLLLSFGVNFETFFAIHFTPLRMAVQLKNNSAIKLLFDHTLRLRKGNYKDKFRSFLFYCAAATGNKEKAMAMINEGTDINLFENTTGNTSLHVAVENELEEMVQLLLDQGANRYLKQLPYVTSLNFTPLHIATLKGNVSIIKKLLKPDPQFPHESICSIFNPGFDHVTPFHIASHKGYAEIQQLFLEKAVSFSKEDHQLRLLSKLLKYGPSEVLKLVWNNYKIHEKLNAVEFQTLLVSAAQSEDKSLFRVFCELVLKANNCNLPYFALYSAVFYGRADIVKYLILNNVDPNLCARYRLPVMQEAGKIAWAEINTVPYFSSILHAAVLSQNEEIVDTLLLHGADVNAKLGIISLTNWGSKQPSLFIERNNIIFDVSGNGIKEGYTPLHFAVEEGMIKIVDKLISFKADVNAISQNLSTPLMLAVQNKYIDIVRSLLKAGANIEAPKYLTPFLCLAIAVNSPSIVELLVEYNAPVNIILKYSPPTFQIQYGFTPLHLAIWEGNLEIIEILLKGNANVNIETHQDCPLHFAIRQGKKDVIKMLIKYGASLETKSRAEKISPFFHVVKTNQLDILKFMISLNTRFEDTTIWGESLLSFAFRNEVKKPMLEYLLTCGIINYENQKDSSLLYETIRGNIPENRIYYKKDKMHFRLSEKWLLPVLFQSSFDPNTCLANHGESILHLAVRLRRVNSVNIILNFGADVNQEDQFGHPPFFYALKQAKWYPFFNSQNLETAAESRNLIEVERIIRSLLGAIALLLATGKEVSEKNGKLLMSKESHGLFIRCCNDEIANLKLMKIYRNISFFDILHAGERKLMQHCRNQNLRRKIRLGFREHFPIYGDVLRFRLQLGVERNDLIEKSLTFFSKVGHSYLPDFIKRHILEHLSPHELKVLRNV